MNNFRDTRCDYDNCVYFKQCNDDMSYLLLYVDDMQIAAKNKTRIQKLKAQLKKEFDVKDSKKSQEDLRYGDHSR